MTMHIDKLQSRQTYKQTVLPAGVTQLTESQEKFFIAVCIIHLKMALAQYPANLQAMRTWVRTEAADKHWTLSNSKVKYLAKHLIKSENYRDSCWSLHEASH